MAFLLLKFESLLLNWKKKIGVFFSVVGSGVQCFGTGKFHSGNSLPAL